MTTQIYEMAVRLRIKRTVVPSSCFIAGLSCEPHPPAGASRTDAPRVSGSALPQLTARTPTQDHSKTPIDSIPLDSCARLDAAARPQNRVREAGDVDPIPTAGSWTETIEVHDSAGRLSVPKAATVEYRPNPHYSMVVRALPGCRYSCSVSVAYGTDLRPSLSVPTDSAPAADSTSVDADDWQPGPARPILMGSDRGQMMELPCGDCNSAEILLTRGQRRAILEFSIDDRDGYQPGIMCRMARVASSYRWIVGSESR